MEKLTSNQLDLLMSLYQGNHIDICTAIGRSLGNITSKESLPYGFTKSTMDTLFTWGMLTDSEFIEHGLRWSRITVNINGINQLKKEGAIL